LLSLHFDRAERWPEAWRYSVEAGRRAEEKFANVEAAQFFERALEAAGRSPTVAAVEAARIWEALGDTRMRLGEYERAGSAYREARRASSDERVEQARLIQKEAMVPLRLARYPQALRRLSHALRTLESVDAEAACAQRARLLAWYGTVLQHQRRPRETIEWCRRAIAEAESCDAQDALAQAYFILDWAYIALGRRQEAVYSGRAAEIYERLGDLDRLAWVLNNMGGIAYIGGHWDEAVGLFERASRTFGRIGDDTHATIAAVNLAEIRSDQGRAKEAEPLFRAALEVRRAAGNPLNVAEALSLLGRHAVRVGDPDEARGLLAEARDLYAAEKDAVELLTTEARRIECLLAEGAPARALELAAEALRDAETIAGVSVIVAQLHRLRGYASMQLGELEAAREALEASLVAARQEGENFGTKSVEYEVALTLGALVRLGAMTGAPSPDLAAERDAIFARLGVVEVKEPPLP
jgi:tetratricopeptide (TPR) repeat protein